MVRDFVTANDYYREFGRFFTFVKVYNWRFLGSVIFAIGFIYQFFYVVLNLNDSQGGWDVILLLGAEFLFLTFVTLLKSFKSKQIVHDYNKKSGADYSSVEQVKSKRLEELLCCKQSDFFLEAKKYDEMLALHHKYRRPFESSLQAIADWVYNKEARPRVITLLVFLASAILLLSVREGMTLKSVFDFYGNAKWADIGSIYFSLVFVLTVSLFSMSVLHRALFQWLLLLEREFGGSKGGSSYAVQYLIRDLIALHDRRPSSPEEPKTLRNAVEAGESSGESELSLQDITAAVKQKHRA